MNFQFDGSTTHLYEQAAVQFQLYQFIIMIGNNLINPYEDVKLKRRIKFQQLSIQDDKTRNKKVIQAFFGKKSMLFLVEQYQTVESEINRILQLHRYYRDKISHITFNGKPLDVKNKTFNEIWPSEQFIELVAMEKQNIKNSEQKLIYLIIQDRYKIVLNEQFNSKDKILNDFIKKVTLNQHFFLYFENRVITEQDTFESLFPNQEFCKLFIVSPKTLQNVEGEINLSLLQFGEIIETFSIRPQQAIYPFVENFLNQKQFIFKNGKVLPKTAKFSIAFKNQKNVCLIIYPKIFYFNQKLKVYQDKIQQIKDKIERLENMENKKIQINEQNSYYFYFEHNSLLNQNMIKEMLLELNVNQTLHFKEIQKPERCKVELISDNVLKELATNQTNLNFTILLNKKQDKLSLVNKVCQECKNEEQGKQMCTFYCEHSFHIECFYEQKVIELKEILRNPYIKSEIKFSCCKTCPELIPLRFFQQFLSAFQQHFLQNLFVRYFAFQNAKKKSEVLLICEKCQFIYYAQPNEIQFSVCQCEEQ